MSCQHLPSKATALAFKLKYWSSTGMKSFLSLWLHSSSSVALNSVIVIYLSHAVTALIKTVFHPYSHVCLITSYLQLRYTWKSSPTVQEPWNKHRPVWRIQCFLGWFGTPRPLGPCTWLYPPEGKKVEKHLCVVEVHRWCKGWGNV